MKHWPGLMGLVAIVMLASACTSTSRALVPTPRAVGTRTALPSQHASVVSSGKWWRGTGVSSCAPAALVHVAGSVMGVGDCAGLFVIPAEKVTVHVGEEIGVHMFEAGKLFTLPRSSASAVLRRIAVSPDGETGTYRAVHAGHATLTSDAWCVGLRVKGEITGRCPVLDVTVMS